MNSLMGMAIAITRDETEASEFSSLVIREGGIAIALPTVTVVPAGQGVVNKFVEEMRSNKHDYCAFMSARAADVLFDTSRRAEILELLRVTKVIAVGPKTKDRLEAFGVKVTLIPKKYSSRGVVEMLSRIEPAGEKIIIPRSAAAGDYAAKALRSLGMIVTEVQMYDVKTAKPSKAWPDFARMLAGGRIDAVVFTSASNVISFFEILESVHAQTGEAVRDFNLSKLTKIISIGPFTSQELRKRKVKYAEAREHTVMGTFELAKRLLHSK